MRALLFAIFCFSHPLFSLQPVGVEPVQAVKQTAPINVPYASAIDIVYTWVDGADPAWRAIRNQYYAEWKGEAINFDANSKNRFRNRNELKYSLRSVYTFAPWVNHIYIVTFGQRPTWLKDHPKITIVDHSEIFQDPAHLPTFNSHAIEANLHRVPGLSERYIYLNDDVLFAAEVSEDDFFTTRGKIRMHFSKHQVPDGTPKEDESAYDSAWRNTNALLNSIFGSEKRFKLAHAPFPLTKSLVQRIENQFPNIFNLVSSHKFRVPTDYTLTNGLIQYYALYMNAARVGREAVGKLLVGQDLQRNEKRIKTANEMTCKFFCVQDLTEKDNPLIDKQVFEFFENKYPVAAPWEK